MKQAQKNEAELLGLVNKIQEQIIALDKKIDALINRSLPQAKASPKALVNPAQLPSRPNDRNAARVMHAAICADCKKECTIPFKPSGDRPVYCQDCFLVVESSLYQRWVSTITLSWRRPFKARPINQPIAKNLRPRQKRRPRL